MPKYKVQMETSEGGVCVIRVAHYFNIELIVEAQSKQDAEELAEDKAESIIASARENHGVPDTVDNTDTNDFQVSLAREELRGSDAILSATVTKSSEWWNDTDSIPPYHIFDDDFTGHIEITSVRRVRSDDRVQLDLQLGENEAVRDGNEKSE
jgi:hypothetical protein